MRSFGYGARVLQKLGVVPYELVAEDIRPALDTGLIGAAEFSLPSIDADLGLAKVAKHLYFPGWQQPVTSLEILMPERTWAALSDQRKAVLEAACGDPLSSTAAEAAMKQDEALAYRAQYAWLGLFGENLESAFDIDAATLLVATVCTH